ncbi:MAG TPA: hypothetical protein VJ777_06000 [Mycobacterium sp.]|nr:hypothetical protein [Mycobacterium sp.]
MASPRILARGAPSAAGRRHPASGFLPDHGAVSAQWGEILKRRAVHHAESLLAGFAGAPYSVVQEASVADPDVDAVLVGLALIARAGWGIGQAPHFARDLDAITVVAPVAIDQV